MPCACENHKPIIMSQIASECSCCHLLMLGAHACLKRRCALCHQEYSTRRFEGWNIRTRSGILLGACARVDCVNRCEQLNTAPPSEPTLTELRDEFSMVGAAKLYERKEHCKHCYHETGEIKDGGAGVNVCVRCCKCKDVGMSFHGPFHPRFTGGIS